MTTIRRRQERRDTATNWATVNPVLAAGEWAVETDTLKVKLGDGVTAWNALGYRADTNAAWAAGDAAEAAARAAADALLVPLTQKGAANGVATLDAGSKIPGAQLPALAISETFTVASQAAMLALTAQRGDIALRTDLTPSPAWFMLTSDSPTTLSDWVRITAAGGVTSVDGATGAVSLSATYVPVADLRYLRPELSDIKRATLARYWGKVKRADVDPVNVAVIGTSISEGVGAAAGTRYLDRLAASLHARHNPVGVPGGGYFPAYYIAAGLTSWTRTGGTPEFITYGPGLRDVKMTATGEKLVITKVCTSFDILYAKVPSGGTFSVKIDGGAPVNVSTANATVEDGTIYNSGDLGGTASRTITIAWVSGTVYVDGGYFYNGDETRGVRVWDFAHQGANLSIFAAYPDHLRALATTTADLVIVELGANDLASLGRQNSVTTMFTLIRAQVPNASIVVVGMYQRTDDTLSGWDAVYADLLAAVNADGNVGFIDIYGRLQGRVMGRGDRFSLLTDTVHPNVAGHDFLGETVAGYLDGSSGASSAEVTPVIPAFAPTDIAGLDLWAKADAITGLADAAAVTSWLDSSGNGRPLVQATGAKQPTYRTAVVNGKPAVRFDGSDWLAASFTRNQPHTVFVVGQTALNTNQYFLDGVTVNTCALAHGSLTNRNMFAGAVLNLTVTSSTGWRVMAGVFNTATSTITCDGAAGTGAVGFANAAGVTIGGGGDQSAVPLTGDIAEVIVYNTALSTTDRRRVEAYLAAKYAITVV